MDWRGGRAVVWRGGPRNEAQGRVSAQAVATVGAGLGSTGASDDDDDGETTIWPEPSASVVVREAASLDESLFVVTMMQSSSASSSVSAWKPSVSMGFVRPRSVNFFMNLVMDMLPVLFLLLELDGVVEEEVLVVEEGCGVPGEFPWDPVAAATAPATRGSSRASSRAPDVR